jgi:hypothetical protein
MLAREASSGGLFNPFFGQDAVPAQAPDGRHVAPRNTLYHKHFRHERRAPSRACGVSAAKSPETVPMSRLHSISQYSYG